MKSLVLVGAAGIIVSVVTTFGIDTEFEVNNVNSEISENRVEFYEENINYFESTEMIDLINYDEIFVEVDQEELKVEDIKVIELEEAIEIDFDTSKYLPYNFQSTEMIDLINYDEIFVEFDQEELKVEDIKVIALEEAIEIDFDTNKYLPYNFQSTEMIDLINFDEIFVDVDQEELKVEDIKVFELEEDVEFDFDIKKYLPIGFNPNMK